MRSDGARVLRRIILRSEHRQTGHTVHNLASGSLLPKPAELRIAKYDDAQGYYLFYCDSDGTVQTDTYHDALEGAIEQARLEFKVKPEHWEEV